MILKCVKVVAAAAFALVSLNVSGQDLLARQAPIDRKLKAVDSVALIRQIKAEKSAYPAYSLYPNWSNERVHAYGNTVTIPDTFRIDMTGFRMPTEHTKITSKFGPRRRRMHNGLDIKVYIGDTIRAAFSGKVRMVKYERRGYGKYVVIRHIWLLVSKKDDGTVGIRADSDTLIVRGILSLMVSLLDGRTACEIRAANIAFIEKTDLKAAFSDDRLNGFTSICATIKTLSKTIANQ